MNFLTLVAKNLLRRKARTLLTCVGIAVAVCAVVALLGVADGFERGFIEAFEGRGVDLIVVEGGVAEQLTSSMDESLGARLRTLAGVRDVACVLLEVLSLEKEGLLGVMVQGWPADCVMFRDLKIVAGRAVAPGETNAAVIGAVLANSLKKSVGARLEIDREEFTIVGVFESFNVFENGSVIVPLVELQRVMIRPQQVTAFSVLLEDGGDKATRAAAVCRAVEGLRDEKGRLLRLSALPTRDYVAGTLQIRMARGMAWVTSAIALLIGAIGMTNTMTTSVLERTREIGILRALGWRQSRLLRMILSEAMLLCLAGAVLGIGAAAGMLHALTSVPSVNGFVRGDVAPPVIALGLLLAAVVGVAGSLYPAWYATRLAPTEALRHE